MPEYFVQYRPYSDWINGVYKVVGETDKYYKVQHTGKEVVEAKTLLVRKSTKYLRGTDIRFYALPAEEIRRKLARQKAILLAEKTDFKKLSDSQLLRIREILEEK